MSCNGSIQSQLARLFALVNELYCRFDKLKQPVSSCLRVTVAGTWGDVGDIIQEIKWFSTPTTFVTAYINETQGRTVQGITTENSEPCEECGECINPDENPLCFLEFMSSGTVNFSDCGDCQRMVSAEVAIVDASDNAIAPSMAGIYTDWAKLGWVVEASQTHPEVAFIGQRGVIKSADTANAGRLQLTGGSDESTSAAGARIDICGIAEPGDPGGIDVILGNVAGSRMRLGRGGSATSYVAFYGGTAEQTRTEPGAWIKITNASIESTGAGSAALGSNCPAVTLTAPFKWLKIITQDGSTAYVPAWK